MVTGKEIREAQRLVQEAGNLYEMAVFDRDDIGVGFVMFAYVSTEQGKHGPRVKFAAHKNELKSPKSFSITVSENPALEAGTPFSTAAEQAGVAWVKKNYAVLLQFWKDSTAYTTKELQAALQSI